MLRGPKNIMFGNIPLAMKCLSNVINIHSGLLVKQDVMAGSSLDLHNSPLLHREEPSHKSFLFGGSNYSEMFYDMF